MLEMRRLKSQPLDFDQQFKRIYLTTPLGDDEDEITLQEGFEKDEEGVEQFPQNFIEKRLKLREYLKELHTAVKEFF